MYWIIKASSTEGFNQQKSIVISPASPYGSKPISTTPPPPRVPAMLSHSPVPAVIETASAMPAYPVQYLLHLPGFALLCYLGLQCLKNANTALGL